VGWADRDRNLGSGGRLTGISLACMLCTLPRNAPLLHHLPNQLTFSTGAHCLLGFSRPTSCLSPTSTQTTCLGRWLYDSQARCLLANNDPSDTDMAAVQNNLLSRKRSARVPPSKSTRNSTPNSETAASSRHHAAVATSPSNVSLFLRNLQLLDLDLLPDWPGLNLLTFTNKDATQGQKKRVQCVEWALYQLFALWDPEEARNVCNG
jgi:hypothetical protein